ncbi:MAG: hypothetical protein IOC58_01750 [Methylobacterium sp.]|nr:hypothetical protein [Methylobacterium sp.]MCA3622809.1 hypothetical protein [Methylobacterium sp.]
MPFKLLLDGEPCEIEILARQPRLLLAVNGRTYAVEPRAGDGMVRIDGETVAFARAEIGETQFLRIAGRTHVAEPARQGGAGAGGGSGANAVKAPMPGLVIRVHKQAGEAVARGEAVITIESMKLQMALGAPRDGVIATLLAEEGGSFDKDAVLALLVSLEGE